MTMEEQEKKEPPLAGRIEIGLMENGAIVPKIEGISPFMVPTVLRRVARLIEKQLVDSP